MEPVPKKEFEKEPEEALYTWFSDRLVLAMVMREAVEIAATVLHSVGEVAIELEKRNSGGKENVVGAFNKACWEAIAKAKEAYSDYLAEWFEMWTASQHHHLDAPPVHVAPLMEKFRELAAERLDALVQKHLEWRSKSGYPWMGEPQANLIHQIARVVRLEGTEGPRKGLGLFTQVATPGLAGTPTQQAARLLEVLGYRRQAGMLEERAKADGEQWPEGTG